MRKIALLRGINVGGKRKILMQDLRELMESIGFTEIKTYIQSGNISFVSPTDINNESIETKIALAIKEHFNYEVPVIVRDRAALIALKNQQAQAQRQQREAQAAKHAKDVLHQLADLPLHRKVAYITKHIIAPVLKPPHGLV